MNRSFTREIFSTEYLGDSLTTINSNFYNLDTKLQWGAPKAYILIEFAFQNNQNIAIPRRRFNFSEQITLNSPVGDPNNIICEVRFLAGINLSEICENWCLPILSSVKKPTKNSSSVNIKSQSLSLIEIACSKSNGEIDARFVNLVVF